MSIREKAKTALHNIGEKVEDNSGFGRVASKVQQDYKRGVLAMHDSSKNANMPKGGEGIDAVHRVFSYGMTHGGIDAIKALVSKIK